MTLTLTKDPSHKGYYQDPDGNLYVFRFGGKPIKVDGYREDKPKENVEADKVYAEKEEIIDHTKGAPASEDAKFIKAAEEEYDKKQDKINSLRTNDADYDTEKNHLESQQRDLVHEINNTKEREGNKHAKAELNNNSDWAKKEFEENGDKELYDYRMETINKAKAEVDRAIGVAPDVKSMLTEELEEAEANLTDETFTTNPDRANAIENELKLRYEEEGDPIKYTQKFHLENPLADTEEAQNYLSSDDMTQYVPEDLKDVITKAEWVLDDDMTGHVDIETTRALTAKEQTDLSDWVEGQNSDGLGEGFEQQDFANAYWNPDTGDGPFTYQEAEEEIDNMISNIDESEYVDYIDESEIEAAVDTYLESNDSVQQWKEDFWNDEIQDGLIQFQDTDSVKEAVEAVTQEDIPEEYQDDVYSYIEESGIKEDVAEEIWQNLASYEQADFVAGYDMGDDMRSTAREEVLSDPESWVSDDAIYEARLAYAENNLPVNVDDWGAMSSIRADRPGFDSDYIIREEDNKSGGVDSVTEEIANNVDKNYPELSKKVEDDFYTSMEQAAKELGYEYDTRRAKEFMEIRQRAEEIREMNRSLQLKYSGTIDTLQKEHPDWSMAKILEKIRKLDEE